MAFICNNFTKYKEDFNVLCIELNLINLVFLLVFYLTGGKSYQESNNVGLINNFTVRLC